MHDSSTAVSILPLDLMLVDHSPVLLRDSLGLETIVLDTLGEQIVVLFRTVNVTTGATK